MDGQTHIKLINLDVSWRAWRWFKRVETCRPKIVFYVINCRFDWYFYTVCVLVTITVILLLFLLLLFVCVILLAHNWSRAVTSARTWKLKNSWLDFYCAFVCCCNCVTIYTNQCAWQHQSSCSVSTHISIALIFVFSCLCVFFIFLYNCAAFVRGVFMIGFVIESVLLSSRVYILNWIE